MARPDARGHAKPPLYRKVNTTAHGVDHRHGGDFRDRRQALAAAAAGDADDAVTRLSMPAGVQRGRDYTPLFRFLLSRVGRPWAEVHAEAAARLDRPDPIFWLVARQPGEERALVRVGESSYYSGLKVDADGLLQRVDPDLGPDRLWPTCKCCTHTFNGQPFAQAHDPARQGGWPGG